MYSFTFGNLKKFVFVWRGRFLKAAKALVMHVTRVMRVMRVMSIVAVMMGFGGRGGESEGGDRSQRSSGKSCKAPEVQVNCTPRHKRAPLLRMQPRGVAQHTHKTRLWRRGYGWVNEKQCDGSKCMDIGKEP